MTYTHNYCDSAVSCMVLLLKWCWPANYLLLTFKRKLQYNNLKTAWQMMLVEMVISPCLGNYLLPLLWQPGLPLSMVSKVTVITKRFYYLRTNFSVPERQHKLAHTHRFLVGFCFCALIYTGIQEYNHNAFNCKDSIFLVQCFGLCHICYCTRDQHVTKLGWDNHGVRTTRRGTIQRNSCPYFESFRWNNWQGFLWELFRSWWIWRWVLVVSKERRQCIWLVYNWTIMPLIVLSFLSVIPQLTDVGTTQVVLHVLVLLFLALCLLFSAVNILISLYNSVSNPYETYMGPIGVYVCGSLSSKWQKNKTFV